MSDKPTINTDIPYEHMNETDVGFVAKMKGLSGVLIATLASLVSIGLVVGNFYYSTTSFNSLSSKVDGLQQQCVDLAQQLGAATKEKSDLQRQLEVMKVTLDDNNKEIAELRSKIIEKEETIRVLQEQIKELTS